MSTICIVVGTVYGNARAVAEQIAEVFCRAGHQVRLSECTEPQELARWSPEGLVVCTSTTGQGELPGNIAPLFFGLREAVTPLPATRYAVVALGDRAYGDLFARAGFLFDALLSQLHAVRLVEPLLLDAGDGRDDEALAADWAVRLAPLFE